MRILLVGSTGVIGRAVAKALGSRHELIEASRTRAANRVDIADAASIRALLDRLAPLDAIVSTAGEAHFGRLAAMTLEDFELGLKNKLLAQAKLALIGQAYLRDGGSVTLTSGVLSRDPIVGGSNAATANAGLEGFARAAAIELPRGLRLNVVSPTVLAESWPAYGRYFAGFTPVDAERVARAYCKSVEGAQTGQIYPVH